MNLRAPRTALPSPVVEEARIMMPIENLRLEGVWLSVGGLETREQAEAVIARIARWK